MDNLTGDLVDYSRQQDIINSSHALRHIVDQSVHIVVGCGGVGYWLALSLAMMGAKDFVFIDGQTIDNTNLNRLPVPQTWVGKNKAVALRKLIRFIRPVTRVLVVPMHITEDTLDILTKIMKPTMGMVHTIWDTTDNAIIQRKVYDFVTALKTKSNLRNILYRKIGYEAWKVGNYAKWDIWTDEDEYQAGYRTSSANSITSMLSAGLGIFALGLDRTEDFNLDIRKLITEGGHDDVSPKR